MRTIQGLVSFNLDHLEMGSNISNMVDVVRLLAFFSSFLVFGVKDLEEIQLIT